MKLLPWIRGRSATVPKTIDADELAFWLTTHAAMRRAWETLADGIGELPVSPNVHDGPLVLGSTETGPNPFWPAPGAPTKAGE